MRLHLFMFRGSRASISVVMLALLLSLCFSSQARAQAFAQMPGSMPVDLLILKLAHEDRDVVEKAFWDLGKLGDANLLPTLEALRGGNLYLWVDPDGKRRVVIGEELVVRDEVEGYEVLEAYGAVSIMTSDASSLFLPESLLESIRISRRLRIKITPILDRLRLFSPKARIRESAATKVGLSGNPKALPMLSKALAKEKDRWVRFALTEAIGLVRLRDDDPAVRKAAAEILGEIYAMDSVPTLESLIEADETGATEETDIAVRAAIGESIQKIKAWEVWTRTVETVFSGVSLSSILLLVALGLAITFGLMGVINMAHGELMMLGAYTTYIVQEFFVAYLPAEIRDFYFILAIPFSFAVSALFGFLLEKSIIKKLYGRPLETLLATWGISLILQQGVRQIFGAANVDVASPAWLSGGLRLAVGIQFPYNRIFIIFLSIVAVFSVYMLVLRSPIGLKIRAVTQNRRMSACMGITTERVDAFTFSLGAGLAGMAGAALTLIGNVGPDLGQNYIVDSFLVVVSGGVGKLAGTVGAAFGIGGLNKLLEPGFGAIYAKVLILLSVILFLQKRPSGLFPAKGRNID